jgi:small GTP-binding protein
LEVVEFAHSSQLRELRDHCFSSTGLKLITIPPNVVSLGAFCFCECQKLKNVSFASNDNLCHLGECCFSRTVIGSISIPFSVKDIPPRCFLGCSRLELINPEHSHHIINFGRSCFVGCPLRSKRSDLKLKMVLIGDSASGKTGIIHRYLQGSFDECEASTIVASFDSKSISISESTLQLEIWDTPGNKAFFSIAKRYLKGADAVALVLDISRAESLRYLLRHLDQVVGWMMVVGSKCDLADRAVTIDEAETFVREHNLGFFCEASAKTGDNVPRIFENLATRVMEPWMSPP